MSALNLEDFHNIVRDSRVELHLHLSLFLWPYGSLHRLALDHACSADLGEVDCELKWHSTEVVDLKSLHRVLVVGNFAVVEDLFASE